MARKGISVVLILSFLWYCGCVDTIRTTVTPQEITYQEQIISVVLIDGSVVDFPEKSGFYNSKTDRFQSNILPGISVAADSVSYALVERQTLNVGTTIISTLAVLLIGFAVLLLIALATKQSCPFVYSFDGSDYEFDAEPLGGAICKGLSRTEYSRLDKLRPVEDQYRLLVRNEVDETQYVDEMKLVLVDHTAGTTVTPSLDGTFYQSSDAILPTRAWDTEGTNLLPFVSAVDMVHWQSNLLGDTTALLEADPWEELTFVFPKPPDATSAEMLLSIGTAHWGSNMIRKHMELYGANAEFALQMINTNAQVREDMYAQIIRDRTLMMNFEVLEPDGWKKQTLIHGCGPLIIEDRAYSVDLTNVPGDSVRIRFQPARGYWTLDYIALAYEPTVVSPTHVVPVSSAVAADGRDVTKAFTRADSVYFEMPEIGDEAWLTYSVPPLAEGLQRSCFLKTSGYYRLHLTNKGEMQAELLNEIAASPGALIRHAMREFVTWKSDPKEFSKAIDRYK